MSGLENDLQQLEAHLDEHFGEAESEQLDIELESDELGEGEEEAFYTDHYCVACNKTFKSDKAFSNHEKSRKHKEMVAIIAEEMEREEADQDVDNDNIQEDKEVRQSTDVPDANGIEDELLLSSEDDLVEQKQKLSKKQKKKLKQKIIADAEEEILAEKIAEISLSNEITSTSSKKQRRKAAKTDNTKGEDAQKETEKRKSKIEDKLNESADGHIVNNIDGCSREDIVSSTETATKEETIENSKEAERVDSKLDLEEGVGKNKGKNKAQKVKETFRCNVCHRGYTTRNKLFDHIKQTGHALRVDTVENGSGATEVEEDERGKKGKKRNRR